MAANNVELWNEIRDQAFEVTLDMALQMVEMSLSPNGEAYGDHQITRGQRILRFQLDALHGAVDILKVQSPKIYTQYVAQYMRDIGESPLAQQFPQPQMPNAQMGLL